MYHGARSYDFPFLCEDDVYAGVGIAYSFECRFIFRCLDRNQDIHLAVFTVGIDSAAHKFRGIRQCDHLAGRADLVSFDVEKEGDRDGQTRAVKKSIRYHERDISVNILKVGRGINTEKNLAVVMKHAAGHKDLIDVKQGLGHVDRIGDDVDIL